MLANLSLTTLLAAALGGALGASARFIVSSLSQTWLGTAFPYGTSLVNILGCLAMGYVSAKLMGSTPGFRALIMSGFLGGFTTFSAFALDFQTLLHGGNTPMAFAYLFLHFTLPLAALFLGLRLAA